MKRNRKAQVLTVALLVAALGAGAARKAGWRWPNLRSSSESAGGEPQNTVYAMIDAARSGNVKAYLAVHTGQMEAALRQVLAETTAVEFARYLRDSNAAVKGVAVSEPRITDSTAAVRVEYVFQDRNEAQTLYLEKGSQGWKISRADSGERIKTLIPYGTPVK